MYTSVFIYILYYYYYDRLLWWIIIIILYYYYYDTFWLYDASALICTVFKSYNLHSGNMKNVEWENTHMGEVGLKQEAFIKVHKHF